MIREAHDIREKQAQKNLNPLLNLQGLKQNIAEESVSNHYKTLQIAFVE